MNHNNRTNTKAVIVWVDDYFGSAEFKRHLDNGLDFWDEMFGKLPEKIYRLFQIDLKVFSNQKDALEFIDSISIHNNTYYFFILDLSLPKDKEELKHELHSPTRGRQLGTKLVSKGIDFAFLSSASGLVGENIDQNLRMVDFYIKESASHLSLPEPLKHKIMMQLRNNIHWIEIKDKLKPILSEDSTLYAQFNSADKNGAFSLFPYFDKYKDFVNLNELDPYLFDSTTFIKSHRHNCEEYEKQCLLIMLTEYFVSKRNRSKALYFTIRGSEDDDGFYAQKQMLESELHVNRHDEIVWCIRLENVSRSNFILLDKALKGERVIYIVHNEDNYEAYLEEYQNTSFVLKELPAFKEDEKHLKQNLVFHTLRYLLNDVFAGVTENNHLYINHPELLLDPRSFIMLSDPSLQIDSLSDSFEIIRETISLFQHEANRDAIALCIKENTPLPQQYMLKLNMDKVEVYKEEILRKTLFFWLEQSWNFPYGINLEKWTDDHVRWQEQSYMILKDLFTIVKEENIDYNCENKTVLTDIQKIILDETFHKLITGEINDLSRHDWDKIITSVRWPHTVFPMPSIIHAQFEKFGKHLWLQEDRLDYIKQSNTLLNLFHSLDDRIKFFTDTVKKIELSRCYLPKEITEFATVMVELFHQEGKYYELELNYRTIRSQGWQSIAEDTRKQISNDEIALGTLSNKFVHAIAKMSLIYKYLLDETFSYEAFKEPFSENAKIAQKVGRAAGYIRNIMPFTLKVDFVDFHQSIAQLKQLKSRPRLVASLLLKSDDGQIAVLDVDSKLMERLNGVSVNDTLELNKKIMYRSVELQPCSTKQRYIIKHIGETGMRVISVPEGDSVHILASNYGGYGIEDADSYQIDDLIDISYIIKKEEPYFIDNKKTMVNYQVLMINYEDTYNIAIDMLSSKHQSIFDSVKELLKHNRFSDNERATYDELHQKLMYANPIDYLSSFLSAMTGMSNYITTVQFFDTQKLMYLCQFFRNNYLEHLTNEDRYEKSIVPNLSEMAEVFIYSFETILLQFKTLLELKGVDVAYEYTTDYVDFSLEYRKELDAFKERDNGAMEAVTFIVNDDEVKLCMDGIDLDCFVKEEN